AGGGIAHRRAPDRVRHRPQRRAGTAQRAAVERSARGRRADYFGPGGALPARLPRGYDYRAAPGRQPRLPRRRRRCGGPARSRPRRAAAARAGRMSVRGAWLLPVSVLLALLLGLLPMPALLQPIRPYWLALVAAYWAIEDSQRVGVGFAFGVGLVAALAFGGLLGEQALRLVVLTFILQRFRTQLRFFPMPQQALAIGGLLLNDRVISTVIHLGLG